MIHLKRNYDQDEDLKAGEEVSYHPKGTGKSSFFIYMGVGLFSNFRR